MEKNKIAVSPKIYEGFVRGGKIHILSNQGTLMEGIKTSWEFLCVPMPSEEEIIFSFEAHTLLTIRDIKIFIEPILKFISVR